MMKWLLVNCLADDAYASYGEFPWTLIIFEKDESGVLKLVCGAALVFRTMAITAAHCIYG